MDSVFASQAYHTGRVQLASNRQQVRSSHCQLLDAAPTDTSWPSSLRVECDIVTPFEQHLPRILKIGLPITMERLCRADEAVGGMQTAPLWQTSFGVQPASTCSRELPEALKQLCITHPEGDTALTGIEASPIWSQLLGEVRLHRGSGDLHLTSLAIMNDMLSNPPPGFDVSPSYSPRFLDIGPLLLLEPPRRRQWLQKVGLRDSTWRSVREPQELLDSSVMALESWILQLYAKSKGDQYVVDIIRGSEYREV